MGDGEQLPNELLGTMQTDAPAVNGEMHKVGHLRTVWEKYKRSSLVSKLAGTTIVGAVCGIGSELVARTPLIANQVKMEAVDGLILFGLHRAIRADNRERHAKAFCWRMGSYASHAVVATIGAIDSFSLMKDGATPNIVQSAISLGIGVANAAAVVTDMQSGEFLDDTNRKAVKYMAYTNMIEAAAAVIGPLLQPVYEGSSGLAAIATNVGVVMLMGALAIPEVVQKKWRGPGSGTSSANSSESGQPSISMQANAC